jgi:hypothetical protein
MGFHFDGFGEWLYEEMLVRLGLIVQGVHFVRVGTVCVYVSLCMAGR